MRQRQMDDEEQLIADLSGAATRGEIVAYYQPQIDLGTGDIVAVESLSRWIHPHLGMQSPLVFIPIAEEFGQIDDIGEFMVSAACETAADFAERELAIEVSVNVSALQLGRQAFFERLESELATLSILPDVITLEITESRFIANRPQVAERLSHLRENGVGISIDDFGVGHSSVEQVLALPASELKIDRTIVQNEDDALMATIVRLAQDRGLRTVAEGVETEAQLQRVRSVGCDRAQGYLISTPVPKDELDELLVERLG